MIKIFNGGLSWQNWETSNFQGSLSKDTQPHPSTLHAFCDASETAYVACVFVVLSDRHGCMKWALLTVITTVALLKAHSTPRLFLCIAFLRLQLIVSVEKSLSRLNVGTKDQLSWTDTTIVLIWLAPQPSSWTQIFAKSAAKNQEETDLKRNHVPTNENLADGASRAVNASTLKDLTPWWQRPEWLVYVIFPHHFCPQISEKNKNGAETTNAWRTAKMGNVGAVDL